MDWGEILSLLITGTLGGLVASGITLRRHRAEMRHQTKHNDQLKRRDTLQQIRLILDDVYVNILQEWKSNDDPSGYNKKLIRRLRKQVESARHWFLDDTQMSETLQSLDRLIGATFQGLDKLEQVKPSERIHEIREKVEERLRQIERELY